jgi:hypothetical protein
MIKKLPLRTKIIYGLGLVIASPIYIGIIGVWIQGAFTPKWTDGQKLVLDQCMEYQRKYFGYGPLKAESRCTYTDPDGKTQVKTSYDSFF